MVCVGCAVGSVPALVGDSYGLVSQSLLTALLPLRLPGNPWSVWLPIPLL